MAIVQLVKDVMVKSLIDLRKDLIIHFLIHQEISLRIPRSSLAVCFFTEVKKASLRSSLAARFSTSVEKASSSLFIP